MNNRHAPHSSSHPLSHAHTRSTLTGSEQDSTDIQECMRNTPCAAGAFLALGGRGFFGGGGFKLFASFFSVRHNTCTAHQLSIFRTPLIETARSIFKATVP